jgi:arabinofuranosyltransferase
MSGVIPRVAKMTDIRVAGSVGLTVLIAAIVISVFYSIHYLPFVADDAFISYRYSDRLLHGGGLTWNDGEHVEGYSNLLWVLLLALGGLLQPDLILVGWWLGIIANVMTLVAIYWTFAADRESGKLPATVGLVTLAFSGSFAAWGVGGLETALASAILAWALATALNTPSTRFGPWVPGVLLGLLSITRPDGILISLSVAAAVLVSRERARRSFKEIVPLVLVPMAFVVMQEAFRLGYYGEWIPNTAYAKLALTAHRRSEGWDYVVDGAKLNSVPLLALLSCLVIFAFLKKWQALRRISIFVFPGVLWLAYLTLIGGDIFPAHRHWMPALICLAFALSYAVSQLRLLRSVAFMIPFLLASCGYLYGQWVDAENFRAALERWEWNGVAIGHFLYKGFYNQKPLLAVDAAGCLPYASRLPAIDMLGLNDSYLAHHRPKTIGYGRLGHELGDSDYVISRKPDLIVFCLPTGQREPCFPGEKKLVTLADFRQNYRLVRYQVGHLEARLWTRVENGRIGVARTNDSIYIPGFLLATTSGARAVLDDGKGLASSIERGWAEIEDIFLPAGAWEISTRAISSDPLTVSISSANKILLQSTGSLRIHSDGGVYTFRVFGTHSLLYSITALRID